MKINKKLDYIYNAFIFGKIGGLKMAKFSKNDFLLFKGKKLTFKRVKYGADIKVQIVDYNPDFKISIEDRNSFSSKVIKVEIVERFGDVKLKVVDHFPDFKVFID